MSDAGQRIDQWLWRARFFKTRSLASKYVNDGNVRVTRKDETLRVRKAGWHTQCGDFLTFSRGDNLLIIEVVTMAVRRGPATEARTLYTDHSPPRPKRPDSANELARRDQGSGRPTKKDRRAIDSLTR